MVENFNLMKTQNFLPKIAILAVIFVMTSPLRSQVCLNGVSTHPLNPANQDPSYPSSNNLWLNNFDFGLNNGFSFSDIFLNPSAGWSIPDFTSPAQFQMLSPFTPGGVPGTSHLSQAVPFQNRDFHWEDGWELLYLGIGYYPNGHPLHIAPANSPISSPAAVYDSRIPYMIYYNRYTGLIRLFAGLITPFGTVQSLAVDLTMNTGNVAAEPPEKYTGLLRHLGNYDTPLDQPTAFRGQRGVNATGFNAGTSFNHRVWYVYDFQVGYDPCTCYSQSQLNFEFNAVEESDISLYGRMITLEENLVDANGNVIYNQDFLTASSIVSQDPNGYIMRKSLDGLVEDYRESLRIYNEQMENRQFGRSGWFRDVLGDLQSTIVGAGVNLVPGGQIAEWMVKKNLNLGVDSSNVEKLVKSGSKALMGGAYNFLSNQVFGENVQPVRPSRPVASFSEMRFSGGITTTNSSPLNGFWTPGSNYSGLDFTPHNYRAYNEVLGLYATLKTPQNQFLRKSAPVTETIHNIVSTLSSNINPNGVCFVNVTGYTLDSIVWKSQSVEQQLFIKLKEPLQYALNAALDFNSEKTKVFVSYAITLETSDNLFNPSLPVNIQRIDSLIIEEDEATNLWIMHDISRNTAPTTKGARRRVQLNSGWYDSQDAANLLFGSQLKTTIYYRERFHEFTPLCGDNYSFNASIPAINSHELPLKITKVEMKVMADMYFDQLSFTEEEINTTQVFTYLLFDEPTGIDLFDVQGNYISPQQEASFVKMYPGELTIESNIITGTSPEVTHITQDFQIIVAAESVIIDVPVAGAIVIPPSNGPLVRIEAFEQIHMQPGAQLSQNLNLRINKQAYGMAPSTPATQTQLSSFCASSSYNAQNFVPVQMMSAPLATIEPVLDIPLERLKTAELILFPNPARSELTIQTQGAGIDRLSIYDTASRPVMQATPGGQHLYQMDISRLAPGVYIVRAECAGEVLTQKLVVAR